MGWYYTSDGERLSQATLDRRIRKAKALKIERFDGEYCEYCGKNNTVIDLSHTVSIQQAKNDRMAELCYSVANLRLLCRDCHRKHDKL